MTKDSKIIITLTLLFLFLILITSSVNAIDTQIDQSLFQNDKMEDYVNAYKNENNYTNPLEKLNQSKKENTSKQPRLNKSKPIYFAMDHVNYNDEEIKNIIVTKLKENGFNVVSAEVGPNKMSQNTLYFYENNITNSIIFHLFNGVDPSTIRELGTNGDDNRGRIVRDNGNDVVLAWFYDSADPVNEGGSSYSYVHGSETGSNLKNPGQFMKDNDIIGICTSSDMGKHKDDADYTGEKTVDEFIKLFE